MNHASTSPSTASGTSLSVPSHHTLLQLLREQLVLTGTKNGCEAGECGACAVLSPGMNGRAGQLLHGAGARSRRRRDRHDRGPGARQPARSAAGGLHRDRRNAVRLLHARHPGQRPRRCSTATPTPARHEIREALVGNLCRCTGYIRIIEAVKMARAARRRRDDSGSGSGSAGMTATTTSTATTHPSSAPARSASRAARR